MAELLVLHDFRADDDLDAARMFYEGGAFSCGYYHMYEVTLERDSCLKTENAVSLHLYDTA